MQYERSILIWFMGSQWRLGEKGPLALKLRSIRKHPPSADQYNTSHSRQQVVDSPVEKVQITALVLGLC